MRCGALVFALLLATGGAARAAGLPVFAGDPIDATKGKPYVMLPGVPLVDPGPDGRFGTRDDIINPALVGDVDLVVRTGGTFAGGTIPAPHAGLAAAPAVTVGGPATATGNTVLVQGILSDGQPPRVTGNPITDSSLDGRPMLAIAWADLDGDGFIGPTAADGDADDEIERQEIMVPAGRAASSIVNGVASGPLALYVGLPASIGGLGVVVTAGATTGTTPYLYFDGPFIATLLPYMPPLDPNRIIGSNGVGAADPTRLLADFELEFEKVFSPPPNHPVLGTPYAIPLDGSSPTVDLVRSVSGAAAGVAFGRPVDPATFVAAAGQQLHPAIGPDGARVLLTDVDAVALASNGDGGAATVDCYVVDRLGNATDPPPGGWTVTLEAGPRVRILAPDMDGDPTRETLTFTNAAAIPVVVDDAGVPAATAVADHVVATRAAAPVGALRADLAVGPGGTVGSGATTTTITAASSTTSTTVGGGTPPTPIARAQIKIRPRPMDRGFFGGMARLGAAPSFDATTDAVTITLASGGATVYTRTLPAGALMVNRAGNTARFRDPRTAGAGRIAQLVLRRNPLSQVYTLRITVVDADLGGVSFAVPLTVTVSLGDTVFAADIPCGGTAGATVTTCARRPRSR